MKIALCLHGRVGSMTGKTYFKEDDSKTALDLSFNHTEKNVLSDNVDVFMHSWSTEYRDSLVEYYKPKASLIEDQIEFEVPSYIKASKDRAFAHLSRWYSFRESVKLKVEYEEDNNFEYDLVLCQRFDLCWMVKLDFTSLDPRKFYIGRCSLNPNREWDDRWSISNSRDTNRFGNLYEDIEKYMGPGGNFTSKAQYAGISSHFLIRHHAKTLGLQEEFKYDYGKDFKVTRFLYS